MAANHYLRVLPQSMNETQNSAKKIDSHSSMISSILNRPENKINVKNENLGEEWLNLSVSYRLNVALQWCSLNAAEKGRYHRLALRHQVTLEIPSEARHI
ncbi:hypothetical protein AB6A40_011675 [Gnathostoma spinigerum]|uniref:Uncharacterized protein n=1 Tax=Gnathostoma spinigerum TaxID=75299 RepID=A0ABD6EYH0_9BILA